MLQDSGQPKFLWVEALAYFVHCQNRVLHSGMDTTPFEMYYRKKPNVSHLHSWGCPVYYRIPVEKQTKLGPHAQKGFFVGVDGNYIYRVYDPIKRDVIKSRNVVFLEGLPHRPNHQAIETLTNEDDENEGVTESVIGEEVDSSEDINGDEEADEETAEKEMIKDGENLGMMDG